MSVREAQHTRETSGIQEMPGSIILTLFGEGRWELFSLIGRNKELFLHFVKEISAAIEHLQVTIQSIGLPDTEVNDLVKDGARNPPLLFCPYMLSLQERVNSGGYFWIVYRNMYRTKGISGTAKTAIDRLSIWIIRISE